MALINCPDCGKPVSDEATHCLCCGRPIKIQEKTEKISHKIKGCITIILIFIISYYIGKLIGFHFGYSIFQP